MNEYKRLRAEDCIDMEAECLYDYVYAANDRYNPHCHEFYEIFITISGTVTHRVNGITQKLSEGSLVLIRPDDYHAYLYDEPESSDTAYVNLTFTKGTMDALRAYLSESFPFCQLLSCDMPPMVKLTPGDKKRLLSRISELNAVNWQDKNALKVHMRAILTEVFVRYFYGALPHEESSVPEWLLSLVALMEKKENFTGGLDTMVSLSGKTREHLARCISKYYSLTTTEFINGLRINYASNLLIHTNTPVLDICFECGFGSVSSFYCVFKEKYGVSPIKFRKDNK